MTITKSAHYRFLREEINRISAISTHDHLMREEHAVARKVDLFDLVFCSLTYVDMVSAGLAKAPEDAQFGPENHPRPRDNAALWRRCGPFLEHVRETASHQIVLRALRELYGFDEEEITESNYRGLNEKVIAAQKPGRFWEVMHEREGLKACLLDREWTWEETPQADRFYTCNISRVLEHTNLPFEFRRKGGVGGAAIETLDQAIAAWQAHFEKIRKQGVIGLKFGHAYYRTLEFDDVPRAVAEKDFPRPDHKGMAAKTVQDFMINIVMHDAGEAGLPVAFHTGYQYGNGNVITNARAQLMCSLIWRHPKTKFDVFHVSYPYCEEAMMLAKYFPNAYFDFCFADSLSPSKIVELLHIGLELLPSNKMFGWGADVATVEMHHGSACVTRDCIARALAERVELGDLTRKRAVRLMQKLMHDNPNEVYRVDDWRAAHRA